MCVTAFLEIKSNKWEQLIVSEFARFSFYKRICLAINQTGRDFFSRGNRVRYTLMNALMMCYVVTGACRANFERQSRFGFRKVHYRGEFFRKIISRNRA